MEVGWSAAAAVSAHRQSAQQKQCFFIDCCVARALTERNSVIIPPFAGWAAYMGGWVLGSYNPQSWEVINNPFLM